MVNEYLNKQKVVKQCTTKHFSDMGTIALNVSTISHIKLPGFYVSMLKHCLGCRLLVFIYIQFVFHITSL